MAIGLLFDELNVLRTDLTEAYNTYGSLKKIPVKDDLWDIILDYLMLAYMMGVEDVDEVFGTNYAEKVQPEDIERVVFEKVAGKDFRQRVNEYVENDGTVEDIMRIAETDTTRIYNEGGLETAEKAGATQKTWNTMMDDRVRDTHFPLQSIKAPIDGYFYTWDNDKVKAPGGFTMPENNINCRCWLTFS